MEPTEELPYHIVWLQDFETELDGSKLFETPRESESKDSRVNSSDASGQMSPGFLIDVDEAQLDKGVLESFLQSKPPIARYRLVQVDADTFRTVIRDPTPGLESVIQLFDNERITVKTIQQREHVSGLQTGIGTWLGKVVGQDASTVQMVIAPDGGVEATFLTSSGRYRLEGIGLPPYHVVWQMDPNATAVTD